ncbi:C2 calcium-dependent membrane targeting [Corchorus olitorius]|uniref:C2 calcium-dependent membrane targeting n=1 Tax=Corchorus olitorius TaxID=93759 RepID=A0A1R3IGZ5_9ROSI|nr:C2 calcium-dependent membrane targeting [Corchorus olitorius]
MEQMRPLEITVISAKGLKKVKHLSKMDVYVAVKISGDSSTEQKTPLHKDGGTSPKWNHAMHFTINETLARTNSLVITFKLICCRTFRGDKDIGEAQVPVKELLDSAGNSNATKYVTYPVKKPSGKPKGELNFLFRFGEKTPSCGVTSYPVHGTAMSYQMYPPPPNNVAVPAYPPVGYPPAVGFQQPVQEGYKPAAAPPPPQPPLGYPPLGPGSYPPPVAPGYGYPPVVQPERKNEGGDGIALGAAALVGGLLGGILLGDLVSDAAASYEAGCDAYDNAASYI